MAPIVKGFQSKLLHQALPAAHLHFQPYPSTSLHISYPLARPSPALFSIHPQYCPSRSLQSGSPFRGMPFPSSPNPYLYTPQSHPSAKSHIRSSFSKHHPSISCPQHHFWILRLVLVAWARYIDI